MLVTAERLSATELACITPPWSYTPAVVMVGLLQADGSCDPAPQTSFTYVKPWTVTDVDPKYGSAGGGTRVLIQGTGFRSYKNVLCRFGENLGRGDFSAMAEVIGSHGTGLIVG